LKVNQGRKLKMGEEDRQKAKEVAVLLALQNDRALIRRDLEIHALLKDGRTEFVSKSDSYESLWQDALAALSGKYS
jgi:hypothetical protein